PGAWAQFVAILLFSGCGTTGVSTRALPAYALPLAKNASQNARTTAYTHTTSDHTQFGARNALGGQLQAAGPAIRRAENVLQARAISTDTNDADVMKLEKFSMDKPKKGNPLAQPTVSQA